MVTATNFAEYQKKRHLDLNRGPRRFYPTLTTVASQLVKLLVMIVIVKLYTITNGGE